MRARCLQDQCKRPDYCCSFTESYSKLLLPLHPHPPFGGFHSSPITSSNDSNLSPRACGLSKNGRHMWGKWEAVAETQRRGTWAPRAIHKDMQMRPSLGLGGAAAGMIRSFTQIHNVDYAITEPLSLTMERAHCEVCAGNSRLHPGSPFGVDLPAGGACSSGGVAPVEV